MCPRGSRQGPARGWRCGRGCRGHWQWRPQGLWLLQPRERNHRAAREEDKVSHAEIHRAGGSMSSAFPLQVSPYLAHTRPQWLFLMSPCPHPSSSSHGMTSTQLTHKSSTRLVLQLCDNKAPCLVIFKDIEKSVAGLSDPLLQEIHKCNSGFSCQNEFSTGGQTESPLQVGISWSQWSCTCWH